MNLYRNILITGASSGIGKELSISYAKYAEKIFVIGRQLSKLSDTVNECRAVNPDINVNMYAIDVRDSVAMSDIIKSIDLESNLDLIIACAGVSFGTVDAYDDLDLIKTKEIFETNTIGTLNTILPAAKLMRERKRGHLVIVGSMAGIVGLTPCPAYSASKAGIMSYSEALSGLIGQYGIDISIVIPGYVKTNMTSRNKCPMPLLMDVKKAVGIIINGISKKKKIISFPKIIYFMMKLMQMLPFCVRNIILKKLPRK